MKHKRNNILTSPQAKQHIRLTINGKTGTKKSDTKINRRADGEVENFKNPITTDELQMVINSMKRKKVAGVDEIWTEEIKSFAQHFLTCLTTYLHFV